MWRHKPEGVAREWPGTRHSLERPGRGSYLPAHDLLFYFFEYNGTPATFACDGSIYVLPPLPNLRRAFERDGDAYLQWDGLTVRVEGLKELASNLRA
ncbi:MAG: hypothetical protein AB8H86_03585 [Polyangiales bacterium]